MLRSQTNRLRRGVATGWLIIWSPIFLAMVLLAIEVGNVMLAKVQLENALEAAALAGVKQWKEAPSDAGVAREAARQYAAANKVSGDSVVLSTTGSSLCDIDIVLGTVSFPTPDDCTQYTFTAGTTSPSANELFGVRTTKSMEVAPICQQLFKFPLGPFTVCGEAAAAHDDDAGATPRLIRIHQFVCP